jgi:hypothetical protein
MTRLFLASIAVVSALAGVPYAVEAQKPTPKKGAPDPESAGQRRDGAMRREIV